MSELFTLKAGIRKNVGTGDARALRENGRVPAIIYGPGKEPISIHIEEKDITKRYRQPFFKSSVMHIDIDGAVHKVLAQAVELHPIKEIVRHVDFVFLRDDVQKVNVPTVFAGKERSIGVKRGGVFNTIKRSLPIECSPSNIPESIVINVETMYVGQTIRAGSIKLPEGCKLLCKKEQAIASMLGRGGSKGGEEEAEAAAAAAASAASAAAKPAAKPAAKK